MVSPSIEIIVDFFQTFILAFIGAFIALFLRESISWKAEGRIEAMKRYEKLISECYGKMESLIFKFKVNKDRGQIFLEIDANSFLELDEINNRFNYRFPEKIKGKIDDFIYKSVVDPYEKTFLLEFDSDVEARAFQDYLLTDIRTHKQELIDKIRKLESYY